jgi:hypothetical protein
VWKSLSATCVPKHRWHADGSARPSNRVFAAVGFVAMWVLLTLVFVVFGVGFLMYLAGSFAFSRLSPLRSSSHRRGKQLANPRDRP